jgi:purine-binding chemotaxis protein CheW
MKKRKKKYRQEQQEQTPASAESHEPIEEMLAALLADDSELDAAGGQEEEAPVIQEADAPDGTDSVEAVMEEAAASPPHAIDPEWAELAAALAELELSELAEESAAEVQSPEEIEAASSGLDSDVLDEIPEPMEAEWELQSQPATGTESVSEPTPEPAGMDWAEPPVSAQPVELASTPEGQSFLAGEEMLGEMLAEADRMSETEPETTPETVIEEAAAPLPPQPPLERVLAGIDEALEKSPALAPAEPVSGSISKHITQLDDYVVFNLAGADYAVPVRDIAEIGRVPSITRVPSVPDFIRGITNLRGEMMPLLSLCGLLGLQEPPPSPRGRVLFLRGSEQVPATGLLVDEVKGIQRIQSQQLEQVTGLIDDKVTSVLRGVHGRGDRLLNILDVEQLFQLQEFRALEVRQ